MAGVATGQNNLAKWGVHGPISTLGSEHANWDLAHEHWQLARGRVSTSFRQDGAVSATDVFNPDGSIAHSRWFYDDEGRLTETTSQFSDSLIDRTVYSYDQAGRHIRTVQVSHDGTQATSEICHYDASGKKTKVRFLGSGRAISAYGTEGSDWASPLPRGERLFCCNDDNDV